MSRIMAARRSSHETWFKAACFVFFFLNVFDLWVVFVDFAKHAAGLIGQSKDDVITLIDSCSFAGVKGK